MSRLSIPKILFPISLLSLIAVVIGIYLNNSTGDEISKLSVLKSEEIMSEEEAVIKVVEEASLAVVSVIDKRAFRKDFGVSKSDLGVGTGFIVEPGNVALTSDHVVEDEASNYVILTPQGVEVEINRIVRDPFNDLAILKLSDEELPALRLGDSDDIRVGQSVIAIGNALGRFTNTVTTGVVSGIGRGVRTTGESRRVESLEDVIQTDAALNPGNSGGPLLNLSGEVIGISSAVTEEAENIGFAIPINTVKQALDSFLSSGRIIRPFLGVRYSMMPEDVAELRGERAGANVLEIITGSAAEAAGIKIGDIVVAVDGDKIDEENPLSQAIRSKRVGDTVEIAVVRSDEELNLTAILLEAPIE